MSLSPEIRQLLDEAVDTLVKWDCLSCLQNEESKWASAEEIAVLTSRSAPEVRDALEQLVESEVLVSAQTDGSIRYCYQPSGRRSKQTRAFADGLKNKATRWLILNYLFEKHGLEETD